MTPEAHESTESPKRETAPLKPGADRKSVYVPPRVLTHSAEELDNTLPRVTACVSFVGP